MRRDACRSAFSVVELLAVLAIVSMLAALLLPTMAQALSSARVGYCLGNMRQVGQAINLYADSNRACIPPATPVPAHMHFTTAYVWDGKSIPTGYGYLYESALLSPEPGLRDILLCPEEPATSFAYTDYVANATYGFDYKWRHRHLSYQRWYSSYVYAGISVSRMYMQNYANSHAIRLLADRRLAFGVDHEWPSAGSTTKHEAGYVSGFYDGSAALYADPSRYLLSAWSANSNNTGFVYALTR